MSMKDRDVKFKIKLQQVHDNLNEAEVTRTVSPSFYKETYVHDVTFLMEYIDELEEETKRLRELNEYIERHGSIPGWD